MATDATSRSSKAVSEVLTDPAAQTPKSLEAVESGMSTSREFANVMAAIIIDVLKGTITPNVAQAAVNAGGKLLKVKELELRCGIAEGGGTVLTLTDHSPSEGKG